MKCFAMYRLPHADQYTLVEQTEGEPLRLESYGQLSGKTGVVMAPFQQTEACPIWLIRPDRVQRLPLQEPSYSKPALLKQEDDRDDYAVDFANFHAQLSSGCFQKIVLARSSFLHTAQPVPPQQLFWKACQLYPRLFIALVSLPNGDCWLTATPEILLEGVQEHWRTIALAGTMQLEGDELLGEGENIRWSVKNIQEQRFVATYIAECLERFSLDFQEEGPRTVRAAHLVHLRSDFTFTLYNNAHVGELLEALHPTPAVCGLPKRDTFNFIVGSEHSPRQYYSGFMGPLNMNNETHLYVSLRCMQCREKHYRLYAGGGLLKESVLEQEWQETEAKMQTMRNLLF